MHTLYDPIAHEYFIEHRRVVSVTQALKLAGKIDDRWFTDAGRERGLRVHAFTETVDRKFRKTLLPTGLVTDGEGDAYLSFLREHQPKWTHIEQGCFHLKEFYGGRMDRAGYLPRFSTEATVEIKTGAEQEWHGLQLAGYQMMLPVGARFVLYLRPNGRFKLVRCTRAADYPDFRECLLYARASLDGSVPV